MVDNTGASFNSLMVKIGENFTDRIRVEVQSDPFYITFDKKKIRKNSPIEKIDGLWKWRGKICLNPESPLVTEILLEMHASALGGTPV